MKFIIKRMHQQPVLLHGLGMTKLQLSPWTAIAGGLAIGWLVRGSSRPLPWWSQVARFDTDVWKAKAPAWIHAPLTRAAHLAGIPPALLAALVRTESAWNPKAISSAGAIGLTQLMPKTAAGLGVDPWDPEANLHGGARYLRLQLNRFGRLDWAVAAYNAGPHNVVRYGGIPPFRETKAYVPKVLMRFTQPMS